MRLIAMLSGSDAMLDAPRGGGLELVALTHSAQVCFLAGTGSILKSSDSSCPKVTFLTLLYDNT